MTAFTEILERLPALSKAEMQQVKARVTVLSQGPSGQVNHADTDVLLVLSVIQAVMFSRGADMTTVAGLQRAAQYRSMADKVPALVGYLHRAGIKDRIEVRAILSIAVDLLYRDLTQMGLTTSSRTIMQHLHRIPAVLNKQFPGYAKMGWLGMLLRTKQRSKVDA